MLLGAAQRFTGGALAGLSTRAAQSRGPRRPESPVGAEYSPHPRAVSGGKRERAPPEELPNHGVVNSPRSEKHADGSVTKEVAPLAGERREVFLPAGITADSGQFFVGFGGGVPDA